MGDEFFIREAEVTLTDRGSEFIYADGFETKDSTMLRTHIFSL